MEIRGTHTLLVDREQAWSTLLDPTTPARLLPGSGTAEAGSTTTTARVVLRDGPVAQDCDVVVERRVVPGGHRLEVLVSTRGAVGRTETVATLRLSGDDPGWCSLELTATVRASGLLRLWGRRSLDAAAAVHAESAVDRLRAPLPEAQAQQTVLGRYFDRHVLSFVA